MIELLNINVNIKKEKILKNINLNIKKGEFLLITGVSGSGKSTLLKLINGIIPHFEKADVEGKIIVDGINPLKEEIYKISRKVTSVFQNPKTSFFNINTRLELIFYLENRGFSRITMVERLKEAEKLFEISHLMDRSIFELSGGEKQIISIAASYMTGCEIFVIDEPTSNLDDMATKKITKMLKILKEKKKTVILAEHRFSFIKGIVDRVVILEEGKIKLNISSKEFFRMKAQKRKQLGLRSFDLIKLNEMKLSTINTQSPYTIENLKISFYKQKRDIYIPFESFSKGEIVGIIGKNGIGKSTFIKSLIGEPKAFGKIKLEKEILNRKRRMKNSFLVMQDVNSELFTESIWTECRLGNDATNEEIDSILNYLKLESLKDKHPMSLSGGQKQRLTIAIAILSKRNILFFDEPTSGMDYKNMIIISTLLRKIANQGKIIIVITHDKEFIKETCDRIINLENYSKIN